MNQIPRQDPFKGEDTYIKICYRRTIEFINNQLNEEEYIKFHEDSNGRNTLPWPELYLLRGNMNLFRNFLLKFKLKNRRLVLTNEEIIGFSQQALYDNYGISFKPLSRFIGKSKSVVRRKFDPKIRNIVTSDTDVFHKEFVAFMALLARVPIDWLEEEIPENKWRVHHLNYLQNSRVNSNELLEIINSTSKEIHDVRGIILALENEKNNETFIRLELINGSFILEILNQDNPLRSIVYLLDKLKNFNIEIGYTKTVIPSQYNFTVIGNNNPQKSIYLPEFKRLQL
ncbi:hypothetical protein ACLM5H_19390 [Fredinandcohnia humi]